MDGSAHGAGAHDANGIEETLRRFSTHALGMCELLVHALLGLMLLAFVFLALRDAGVDIYHYCIRAHQAQGTIETVDKLLFVLMLTEILHTVGISIRSHKLVIEPFLLVAIIASIRRMLVITLEGSTLTSVDSWNPAREAIFRVSLMELGLLAMLVLILVCCILLLRRAQTLGEAEAE